PSEPPPSYEQVTGSSPNHPETRNGIPPEARRSMEDLLRPLPSGWIRQYDPKEQHQFFVDTNADPPRSIWHHPYDDDQYLSTLSSEERENVTRLHRSVSLRDIEAEESDDEGHGQHARQMGGSKSSGPTEELHGIHKFGRKLKDKITQSTHEERERRRAQRAQQEREYYEAHLRIRNAMAKAIQTGQPQLLGRDRDGRDVYLEPPNGAMAPRGAFGFNPYSNGMFASPNSRFIRPAMPYRRPMGYGYGAGYGFPLLGAGLLGGMLLGDAMF
ncbi:hypothetical protein M501DRAFT_918788, partial [Patellaria atrata CBS 101060]